MTSDYVVTSHLDRSESFSPGSLSFIGQGLKPLRHVIITKSGGVLFVYEFVGVARARNPNHSKK